MRAAVMTNWELRVDDIDTPTAGPGQVLTKVLSCGICGSDLHMLVHGEESRRLSDELEEPGDPAAAVMFAPANDMVMGHEFCCEVVELGPDVDNLQVGDVVVSMPIAFDAAGVHPLGFSNIYPGGYAEYMVLNELLAMKVPAGLPHRMAALTEPLAVGVHAVAKSGIAPGDAAIVIGLGPVGLACIAAMKLLGIGPIVGADFSPTRRALAEHLGCDEVVDPNEETAIRAWRRIDGTKPLVVFEAVGVPGMIEQTMRMAPKGSRILIVGACMQEDRIHPMLGVGKELSLQFVLGYEPHEFVASLDAIATERVDLAPLLTGTVTIDGIPQAFTDLADPEAHAKILVEP
ncbi:MAG TPA: zinc-binding dehydrogenase [Ilumatobacteraceae bacterium]|nr:zinc-binding dehydrogenase [Ilumatobacteraceae bacterium]